MSRATEELLERLHNAVAEQLLARISDGEATAADIQAAIKFLKDNGIDGVAKDDSALDRLNKRLQDIPDDALLDNVIAMSTGR